MEKIKINFAKHQKLPEGYRIEWWESVEHYVWVKDNETESVIFADRWQAYRSAWAHSRE